MVWLSILIVVIIVTESLRGSKVWQSWERHRHPDGRSEDSFCEYDRVDDAVMEPSNSFSAFFYLAAGLYILNMGLYDYRIAKNIQKLLEKRVIATESELLVSHHSSSRSSSHGNNTPQVGLLDRSIMMQQPSWSLLYGIVNLIHAFGVFWNHACRCVAGARWDVAGMLGVIVFPMFFLIYVIIVGPRPRPRPGQSKPDSAIGTPSNKPILLIYLFAFAAFFMNQEHRWITPLVFSAGLIVGFVGAGIYAVLNRHQRIMHSRLLLFSALFMALGIFVWAPGYVYNMCFISPTAIIQPHAVWHFATSLTIVLAYLFFRSIDQMDWLNAARFDMDTIANLRNLKRA
jgi:hypothetical protein